MVQCSLLWGCYGAVCRGICRLYGGAQGCVRLYWVVWGCIGLYGAVWGCIWAVLGLKRGLPFGLIWASMLVGMVLYVGGKVSHGGGLGALMGLSWGCYGAATGLPRGCQGALWGSRGFLLGSRRALIGASMGLPWSFHAAPDGAAMEFLCGFYGPPVRVVWECRYAGCILGIAPLWLRS